MMITAPSTIAPICPTEDGTARHTRHAATATLARARSGASDRAIPHTACATTATATSFSPCSHPACDRSPTAPTP